MSTERDRSEGQAVLGPPGVWSSNCPGLIRPIGAAARWVFRVGLDLSASCRPPAEAHSSKRADSCVAGRRLVIVDSKRLFAA